MSKKSQKMLSKLASPLPNPRVERGQFISWQGFQGRRCGIVLDTFQFKIFDEKVKEGVFVLSNGEVYKIYDPETLKIIKDAKTLFDD